MKINYKLEAKIGQMSYNELAKLLSSGEVDEKALRTIYNKRRKIAMQREHARAKSEFAEITEQQTFRKSSNLITTRDLLHELSDVNRFLKSKTSTVTGLQIQREKYIKAAQSRGFDVDKNNYIRWVKFLNWFKDSAYSLVYDSDSEEVEDVFNQASSEKDWEKLFDKYERKQDTKRGNR